MPSLLLLVATFHCLVVNSQPIHDEALRESTTNDDDTVGSGGMIASNHYLASEAGAKILAAGGTAADAAVAVQLVLNVVQPCSTGIGGGAFIVYYDAKTEKVYNIDGREEAPDAYNPYVFCADSDCWETNGASGDCDNCDTIHFEERIAGGLSIGVPGTLYAFKRMWDVFGSTEWSDLFEDAMYIARNGFTMYRGLYNYIKSAKKQIARSEAACKIVLNYPDCDAPKWNVGDSVTFPDLAETFRILSLDADDAIDMFYEGTIAHDIVNAATSAVNPVTGRNGVLSMDDMKGYKAVFREPVSTTFNQDGKEYEIYGMGLPSSGSLTVQYQLKMMEYLQTEDHFNSFDSTTVDPFHYLFAAQNIAFADRDQYMADQDFVNVPLEGLQDETYLKQRAIDYLSEMAQSLPIPFGEPDGWNDEIQSSTLEGGTSHICIVDQYGNVASITTTIEMPFGSRVAVDGWGFFLNNELTDFSSVGVVNGKTVANGPEGGKKQRSSAIDVFDYADSTTYGGKRPRSSMSPTIVLYDGAPYLAAGSPGGSTIIGTTFGIVSRSLIYGIGPQEAINAPRVWGRNNGNIECEIAGWKEKDSDIIQELISQKKYHPRAFKERSWGHATAIRMDKDSETIHCGHDINRWSTTRCVAVCGDDSKCLLNERVDPA